MMMVNLLNPMTWPLSAKGTGVTQLLT